MARQEKARQKQGNKKINKYLRGLIQQHAKENLGFGRVKKTVEMLLWLWVGLRILALLADFAVLVKLEESTSSITAYEIGIVVVFVELFKAGNRWGAILPLIGAVINFFMVLNQGFMTLFSFNDGFIKAYSIIILVTIAYQAAVMLYILFAPKARVYQNEIKVLKERAKTMDLAA